MGWRVQLQLKYWVRVVACTPTFSVDEACSVSGAQNTSLNGILQFGFIQPAASARIGIIVIYEILIQKPGANLAIFEHLLNLHSFYTRTRENCMSDTHIQGGTSTTTTETQIPIHLGISFFGQILPHAFKQDSNL